MVQELFPTVIARVPQMDMYERIAVRFPGFFDEFHVGLSRSPPPLLGIASNAGTHNVLPHGFPPQAPGKHMIKRQLLRRKVLTTVLASIMIPGKQIPPVEFHLIARETVIKKQANDPGHGYMKVDR